jgi:hypothetical protein
VGLSNEESEERSQTPSQQDRIVPVSRDVLAGVYALADVIIADAFDGVSSTCGVPLAADDSTQPLRASL